LSLDIGAWLDAVWAAYMDAPHQVLEKAQAQMIKAMARARPEEARETWGLRPEHRAMTGQLDSGPGAAPATGPVAAKDAEIDSWVRRQAQQRAARRPGRTPKR
jgi:hypothetical protein